MASQNLSNTPTALTGTTAGTDYTLQCQTPDRSYIQVASTSTPPTDTSGAFVVGAMSFATAKHGSGEAIYVWQDQSTAYGRCVFDESA